MNTPQGENPKPADKPLDPASTDPQKPSQPGGKPSTADGRPTPPPLSTEADIPTMVEEVYHIERTLPEGAFDKTLTEEGLAAPAAPPKVVPPKSVNPDVTLSESQFADVPPADDKTMLSDVPEPAAVDFDRTLPEGSFENAVEDADKTMLSDAPEPSSDDFDKTLPEGTFDNTSVDADKTLQSDAPEPIAQDFERTLPEGALVSAAEDVERTMLSDAPEPVWDEDKTLPDGALLSASGDADKTLLSDVPDASDVDFEKTLPDGALQDVGGDADKTMLSDAPDATEDFDKTLPDGALVAAAADADTDKTLVTDEGADFDATGFDKTLPDGALAGADDDKTILGDLAAQADVDDPGKTQHVDDFEKTFVDASSGADESVADDRTVAIPEAGRPKKDKQLTSVADTATSGTVPGPKYKEALNVAPRAVSGLAFGDRERTDYRVMRQLGEGGMGVVYVARQASLGREVVMKTLKPMPAEQASKLKSSGRHSAVIQHRTQMFLSEAVVTADLFHPNIVPIYDLGEAPDGSLFYTMKWVRGIPWNKRLKDMTLEENLEALLKVADAVAFAHARFVINRDLKPENVMLGEFGEVAVLDWGLAMPFGEGKNRLPLSITAGLGSGTPAYMPPELILGPLEKLGPACDIYLLGAMLFEIATGLPPHDFQMDASKSANQKMATIRKVVSENILRSVEHKGELMDIALKALATKPEDRFRTVQELQQAIREYQRHAASRHLAERAQEMVAVRVESGETKTEPQTQGYAAFQNALALYQESLREWPHNQDSREGLTDTQLRFAQLALQKGDYDLGLSVLDTNADSHAATRTLLLQAREERDSRVRRLKVLKVAASVMALGLVVFLAVAARLQFNLTEAIAKAADADKRAQEADEAFQAANIAKAEAVNAKLEAEKTLVATNEKLTFANEKIVEANQKIEVANKNLKEADAKLLVANNEVKTANQKAAELDAKAKKANENLVAAENNLKKTQKEFAEKQEEFRVELGAAQERTSKANYLAGLAEANRYVQEGRYSDARRRLEQLKKDYAERCKTEWDQLWNTVNAAQAVSLHKPVEAIGISRDGRVLVAADNAGGVVSWKINDQGRIEPETARQFAFGSRPRTLAVSPDGKTTAVAGEQGTIEIRTLADGQTKALKGHEGPINTLKFSADNRLLVSGGADRTIRIWDVGGGHELTRTKVLYGVTCVDWSREGTILVAGTSTSDEASGVAYAWAVTSTNDAIELAPLRTFQVPPEGRVKQDRGVLAIALTEDGKFAVSNGPAAEIHLWQTDLRKENIARNLLKVNVASAKVGLHSKRVERVRWLSFNPDASRLLAAGDDGTISVWERRESVELPRFDRTLVLYGHSGPVRACAQLPQSPDLVVSGSYDQHVHVWNLKTYPDSRRWLDHPEDQKGVAQPAANFSRPQVRTLAWQRDTTPQWAFRSPWEQPRLTRVSQQEPAQTPDNKPRAPTVQIVTGHTDSVLSAVFRPDGRRVLSASRDQTARVWDSQTGQPVGSSTSKQTILDDNVFAEGHEYDLFAMRFFPDGNYLLTSGFDGAMRIWDARINAERSAGRELATLPETGMYGVVEISDDGQWILTAGRKNSAQLWNTQSVLGSRRARPDFVLDGPHRFRVTTVAISPDAKRLLTADREGFVVFWDRETGKVIGRQRNTHIGEVVKAEFLGNGSQLLTSGVDRRVVVWDLVESDAGISLRKNRQFEYEGMVINLVLSPKADRFFCVTRKGTRQKKTETSTNPAASTRVSLRNLNTGEDVAIVFPASAAATALVSEQGRAPVPAWSANGGLGLITTPDGAVHFVDADSGRITRSLQVDNRDGSARRAQPFATIARPDEPEPQHLVTQTHNAAYLWRLKDGANLVSFRPQGPVFAASYSSDGRFIVTGGRSVRVFDATESNPTYGRLLHKVEYPHLGIVTSAEFSPAAGSQRFLTTSFDGTAKVWEWQPEQRTVQLVHELSGHTGAVRFGAWSADGTKILTVGHDAKPRVWSLAGNQVPQSVVLDFGVDQPEPGQDFDQLCGVFSWNGRFVAVGGRDVGTQESVGWIWDLAPAPNAPPILHAIIRGHGLGGINSVSFLPDDDRLLTGGTDGTARLWDWQRGEPRLPNTPALAADFLISLVRPGEATTHRGSVTSVRVTRDGTIVTASSDGTVIIWPTASKQPVARN